VTDALMVALMVGFFVLAGFFVAWLDRVWASPTSSSWSLPWVCWCTSQSRWSARRSS